MARKRQQKREKPIYELVVEGRNKTETLYFENYKERTAPYVIRIQDAKCGDIKGMFAFAEDVINKDCLSIEKGDRVFIITDSDCKEQRLKDAAELSKTNKAIEFVISRPCFEIWFCLHFKISGPNETKHKLFDTLRGEIKDYEKNKDYYDVLLPKRATAIQNNKQFKQNPDCSSFLTIGDLVEILLDLADSKKEKE